MKTYKSIGVKNFEGDISPVYIPIPDNFTDYQTNLLVGYAKQIQLEGVVKTAKEYLAEALTATKEENQQKDIHTILEDEETLKIFQENAKKDINVH